DAAQKFLQLLQEEADELKETYIKAPKPMEPLTAEELLYFSTVENCHICGRVMGENRVKDHCHITGNYRGAAHNACNLNYRLNKDDWRLPVFIHNLKGYDSHLIIKALKKEHGSTWLIPQNMEKYLSFSVGTVRFLDSMQFMPESLDKLVKNLNPNEFNHVQKAYPLPDQFELVSKKGTYPYDYMSSFQKFDVDHLPSQDEFFSKLIDTPITDVQYAHAQQVWETFDCQTMADYHDLYLECDVLLLADVFEKFRKMCLTNYGLDAAHYFTSPGLSFDAALRMTNINLQVLPDIDMVHFVENGIRGGISMITTRYAEANNPHIPSGFDPMSRLAYLIYLDANNLYGWAMSQLLPTHGFRWLTLDEIR
ncbi:MAG: DNA polymerase, partial [Candidatus Thioglobus sp.]